MASVTVAATQMACTWNREENLRNAEELVREAAGQGAQIVLLQELFETPYFCKDQKEEHFALARVAVRLPASVFPSSISIAVWTSLVTTCGISICS